MARDPVLDPSGLARAAERLASLVPGYTAYKERERRREEDRAVRQAVARQLGVVIGRMERAFGRGVRTMPPKSVETADRLIRRLGRERDRIHFAPEGYASLFARKEVDNHALQSLLSLDTGMWAALEALDRVAGEWDAMSSGTEGHWPQGDLEAVVDELEDALDARESFLRS